MDFAEVPEKILVVVDRLTRGVIIARIESTTAEGLASEFIRSVVAHHGLPDSIVSDRGPQLVSEFWKSLCQMCNIELKLATPYHQQTDGLSERMIQSIKDYLRKIDEGPINERLALAQLAINSRVASSTGYSPFVLTHGHEARLTVSSPHEGWLPEPGRAGEAIAKRLQKSWEIAQATLATAQERQEKATNRHRFAAPAYRVGDKVWLAKKSTGKKFQAASTGKV
jgi:hypothetical protein